MTVAEHSSSGAEPENTERVVPDPPNSAEGLPRGRQRTCVDDSTLPSRRSPYLRQGRRPVPSAGTRLHRERQRLPRLGHRGQRVHRIWLWPASRHARPRLSSRRPGSRQGARDGHEFVRPSLIELECAEAVVDLTPRRRWSSSRRTARPRPPRRSSSPAPTPGATWSRCAPTTVLLVRRLVHRRRRR